MCPLIVRTISWAVDFSIQEMSNGRNLDGLGLLVGSYLHKDLERARKQNMNGKNRKSVTNNYMILHKSCNNWVGKCPPCPPSSNTIMFLR